MMYFSPQCGHVKAFDEISLTQIRQLIRAFAAFFSHDVLRGEKYFHARGFCRVRDPQRNNEIKANMIDFGARVPAVSFWKSRESIP